MNQEAKSLAEKVLKIPLDKEDPIGALSVLAILLNERVGRLETQAHAQQLAMFNYVRAVNGLAYAVSSFAGTDAVKEVFETSEKLIATFDPEVRREVGWTGGDK